MRTGIIVAAVLLLVAGLGAYRVVTREPKAAAGPGGRPAGSRGRPSRQAMAARAIPVSVATPDSGTIEETASFVADVKGENQVTIYPDASGKLIRYAVREGQYVGANAVIALIDRAQAGMQYEPLKARTPIAGTVAELNLDRGAHVSLQTPLAVIANLHRIKVEAHVPERYVHRIRTGMEARVRVEAYPDSVFTGTVSTVSPVINPRNRTFRIDIRLRNPDRLLRPGMFADVTVVLDTRNTLLVDRDAVLRDLETGDHYIYTAANNTAHRRPVELGIEQRELVEVVTGIEPADTIVVLGHDFLSDSQKVEIVQ